MSFTIERDWTTKAGFRAVVMMGGMGHRCGYVGVPSGHPLHGVEYGADCAALVFPENESIGKRGIIPLLCANGEARPDVVFNVHGGLTYSVGNGAYPVESDLWWFGFDCSHAGDAPSPEYCAKLRESYPDQSFMWRDRDGTHRSLAYCVEECELLAQQFVDRVLLKVQP